MSEEHEHIFKDGKCIICGVAEVYGINISDKIEITDKFGQ